MSGGLIQLVATGAQDVHLTSKPDVSFFRSGYKRYTHFSNSVERQLIQGNPAPDGMSTIRIEKKGDLLSYTYMTAIDPTGALIPNIDWTSNVIDKVELLIGGQVIDTQDSFFSTYIEPVTGATNMNQRLLPLQVGVQPGCNANSFYPFKFFFCKDWQSALPIVALQYHDVEFRITWSSNLGRTCGSGVIPGNSTTTYARLQYVLWSNFIYLDQAERDYFMDAKQYDMLITQVQRQAVQRTSVMELTFAHPVKYLAFQSNNYASVYSSSPAAALSLQMKTQVNGVDIGDFRPLCQWVDTTQYYHSPYGYVPTTFTANVAVIPYCLDTSKLQPTGTLNFSRVDTYRLVTPTNITIQTVTKSNNPLATTTPYIYAVNYNILRITDGMGAILYSS
jgi:hypothetical protein